MTELEAIKIAHNVAETLEVTAGKSVRPIVDALFNATAAEREACANRFVAKVDSWGQLGAAMREAIKREGLEAIRAKGETK